MLPVLLSIGAVEIRTINVFYVLAFFASGFILWRKGREEHYEEDTLFDGFLQAFLVGGIIARIGFIVLNFSQFGFDILRWLDVFSTTGFSGLFGFLGGTYFIYRYAIRQKWDAFEILDFWVTALSLAFVFLSLGSFLDGTSFGLATSLPWGMVFPGVFEKYHPVQLYSALIYTAVFIYLSRIEYRYRTFLWYKSKRKSAQTGFLFCNFLIIYGFVRIILAFISPSQFVFFNFNFDWLIGFIISITGLVLLYDRSGRDLPFRKKV